MNVWHAIHPSPYSDDCPTCAGYVEDPEPRTYSTNPVTSGVWFLAGLLVAIAVLVAYALVKGGAR